MIAEFYPALVVVKTSFVVAPGQNVVNVRSTDAASEIANAVDWLQSN